VPTRSVGGGDKLVQAEPARPEEWGPNVLHVCDCRLLSRSRQELRLLLNNPEDSNSHAVYVFVLSIVQIKSFTSNTSHSATVSQSFQLSVKIFSHSALVGRSAKIFLRHHLNPPSVALIC